MSTDRPQQLYRHFDKGGALLYVGVSLCTFSRLAQHREHSFWFKDIARIEVAHFPNRPAVLAAERAAILAERPAHNIKHASDIHKVRHESRARAIEASVSNLETRVLKVSVMYRVNDLRAELLLSRRQILDYMDSGKLGFVELPKRNTSGTQRYVTGWQLIDFMEYLQTRAKGAQ